MALTDSLVAYWSLEADGNDSVGTSHLVAGSSPSYVAGLVGNAADFERTTGHVLTCADNAAISMGDIDMTICTWVKLEEVTGIAGYVFLSKFGLAAGKREYLLLYNNTDHAPNQRFSWAVSGDGTTTNTLDATTFGAPSAGVWYFVVASHDATANTISISVNNGTVDSKAHTTGINNADSALQMGQLAAVGTYRMDGLIDETGIWKRVLTSAEITWLYNAGAGRSYAAIVAGMGGAGLPVIAWEHARIFGG